MDSQIGIVLILLKMNTLYKNGEYSYSKIVNNINEKLYSISFEGQLQLFTASNVGLAFDDSVLV